MLISSPLTAWAQSFANRRNASLRLHRNGKRNQQSFVLKIEHASYPCAAYNCPTAFNDAGHARLHHFRTFNFGHGLRHLDARLGS